MGIGDRDYMRGGSSRGSSGRTSGHSGRSGGGIPRWAMVTVAVCVTLLIWHAYKDRGSARSPAGILAELKERYRMNARPRALGAIEMASGKLALADPGLTAEAVKDGKLAREVEAAKGAWTADVVELVSGDKLRSIRSELRAWLTSAGDPSTMNWEDAGVIEVHGSSVGIFDAATFRQDAAIPADFKWNHPPAEPAQKWYSACLEVSRGLEGAGTMSGGAVAVAERGPVRVVVARNAGGMIQGVRLLLYTGPVPNLDAFDEYE